MIGLAVAWREIKVPLMARASSKNKLVPRLRVNCGDEVALGPGKADLLDLVAKTGSIREAAERMDMSYMRAWKLIQTMNACFREPLVNSERGGSSRGGAQLTRTGKRALELYRGMEREAALATEVKWRALARMLRGK
jgi:molybdate transport system regulatory protein